MLHLYQSGSSYLRRVFSLFYRINSSVMRQKGESQNGCFKKTKHVKFSEKRTFFTRWYAHDTSAYQGVKNVRFSEILTCFVFLKHPFWDSSYLPYYRRIVNCAIFQLFTMSLVILKIVFFSKIFEAVVVLLDYHLWNI